MPTFYSCARLRDVHHRFCHSGGAVGLGNLSCREGTHIPRHLTGGENSPVSDEGSSRLMTVSVPPWSSARARRWPCGLSHAWRSHSAGGGLRSGWAGTASLEEDVRYRLCGRTGRRAQGAALRQSGSRSVGRPHRRASRQVPGAAGAARGSGLCSPGRPSAHPKQKLAVVGRDPFPGKRLMSHSGTRGDLWQGCVLPLP